MDLSTEAMLPMATLAMLLLICDHLTPEADPSLASKNRPTTDSGNLCNARKRRHNVNSGKHPELTGYDDIGCTDAQDSV
jgi:hypothetical protein